MLLIECLKISLLHKMSAPNGAMQKAPGIINKLGEKHWKEFTNLLMIFHVYTDGLANFLIDIYSVYQNQNRLGKSYAPAQRQIKYLLSRAVDIIEENSSRITLSKYTHNRIQNLKWFRRPEREDENERLKFLQTHNCFNTRIETNSITFPISTSLF